jgi:hypothetical protein
MVNRGAEACDTTPGIDAGHARLLRERPNQRPVDVVGGGPLDPERASCEWIDGWVKGVPVLYAGTSSKQTETWVDAWADRSAMAQARQKHTHLSRGVEIVPLEGKHPLTGGGATDQTSERIRLPSCLFAVRRMARSVLSGEWKLEMLWRFGRITRDLVRKPAIFDSED